MGTLSNLFKWIFGIFRRKKPVEKEEAEVKKDLKEEEKEEKFVEERIAEVAEDLSEAQIAEKVGEEAEKIEESGQASGKSLEEVEKEEQEMILKMEEFEKELGAFEKQLNQILTREEQQDEDMEQKIELAKDKSEEYRQKLSSNVDVGSKQWENIFHQVELISGKVKRYIEAHRRTVESVKESLDGNITRTMEHIEELRKIKSSGGTLISLFKTLEFNMSSLKQQLVKDEVELEKSREARDNFLKGWFELMDEELSMENTSEEAEEKDEDFWGSQGVNWK